MPNIRGAEVLILFVVSLVPAVVPIVIAYVRNTNNRKAVLWVALLTSWTLIGWVAAVIMSAVGKPEAKDLVA